MYYLSSPVRILGIEPIYKDKVATAGTNTQSVDVPVGEFRILQYASLSNLTTDNKLHKIAIQDAGGQNYILKLDTQEVIAGEPVVVIWNGVLFLRGGDKVLFKWMDASASDSLRCFLSWLRVVIE